MQKEIRQLQKKLELLSVSQLATELGYRSPNTVQNWLKKGEVPTTAMKRVKDYLAKGT